VSSLDDVLGHGEGVLVVDVQPLPNFLHFLRAKRAVVGLVRALLAGPVTDCGVDLELTQKRLESGDMDLLANQCAGSESAVLCVPACLLA
jgi:hypothetical protein